MSDPVEHVLCDLQGMKKRGGASMGNMLAVAEFPSLNYLLNRSTAKERRARLIEIIEGIGNDNDLRLYAYKTLLIRSDSPNDRAWNPYTSAATVTRRSTEALIRVARSVVEQARVEQVDFFEDFAAGVLRHAAEGFAKAGITRGSTDELVGLVLGLVLYHKNALAIIGDVATSGWDERYRVDVSLLKGRSETVLHRITTLLEESGQLSATPEGAQNRNGSSAS